MSNKVTIDFTKEEALVLYDYLARVNKDDSLKDSFEHYSEQRVMWDLEAMFEKVLVEPFWDNYLEVIQKARNTFSNFDDNE